MTISATRKRLLSLCGCCPPTPGFFGSAVSRRDFLAGSAATGLGPGGAGDRLQNGGGTARQAASH